jgi:hypothetical protein
LLAKILPATLGIWFYASSFTPFREQARSYSSYLLCPTPSPD